MTEITVFEGDITSLSVTAIVNAANSRLAGGGGVDGAIHRAAGHRQLQAACAKLGGCPTGQVRLTGAFELPSEYIIHAVGPVWHGGKQGEEAALRSCYREAMRLAIRQAFESIAFPAISCGVYGYPWREAVGIAVTEVTRCLQRSSALETVVFCCFDTRMADLYRARLASDRVGGG